MPSILRRAASEVAPHRRAFLVGAPVAAVWAVWASGPGWSTPALVVLAVAGVALALVDLATHRLPNAIVYPTTVVVLVLLALAALGAGTPDALVRALVGGLGLGVAYLALHLVSPAGLGLGDVKLSVVLGAVGAWYGWDVLWAVAILPIVGGGLVSIALLVTRRAHRGTAIAVGPFMLAGTALAVTGWRLGLLG